MYNLDIANDEEHIKWMRLALEEAKKCQPTLSAYCVGAVIVCDGKVQSTGFSRELRGNTHAEESALLKLQNANSDDFSGHLEGVRMYTTMEPCSMRLSGNKSCTSRIIEAGVSEVYFGVKEPDIFVVCEGIKLLKEAKIKVFLVSSMQEECLQIAKKGL